MVNWGVLPLRWLSSPLPARSQAGGWRGSAVGRNLWGSVPACLDCWSRKWAEGRETCLLLKNRPIAALSGYPEHTVAGACGEIQDPNPWAVGRAMQCDIRKSYVFSQVSLGALKNSCSLLLDITKKKVRLGYGWEALSLPGLMVLSGKKPLHTKSLMGSISVA